MANKNSLLNYEGLEQLWKYITDRFAKTVQYTPQGKTESEKEQARKNIGVVEATDDEAMDLLMEMEVIIPAADENGEILTDEEGSILTI